jgi:hypothetical protein
MSSGATFGPPGLAKLDFQSTVSDSEIADRFNADFTYKFKPSHYPR